MVENCSGTYGPTFDEDETNQTDCVQNTNGGYCPPINADKTCNDFQFSNGRDNCIIDNYVNEALNIGSAQINVFKLLGVHEQEKLLDSTGQGTAISGGYAIGYPQSNAFDVFISEWRSSQTGSGVISDSYIGYDFGPIKLEDQSRVQHGIPTSIRKHITAFKIKQGKYSKNRVTKARLERSEDGITWYGVQIVNLPDDDCLNTIQTKHSVPSRYWRLRPLAFNGSNIDYWIVQALQLSDGFIATNVHNIQDKILMENRDRNYAEDSLMLKASYDLQDVTAELSRFIMGYSPVMTMSFSVSFSSCVAILGRPLIIGDILEIPSEAKYSAEMRRILRWMEVTDVAWSTEGYTPGWTPTILRVIAQPAIASQETQDIFGDLANVEENGVIVNNDGNGQEYQDFFDISQTIEAQAKEDVPERGTETSSHIRSWEEEELQSAAEQGLDHLSRYGEYATGVYNQDAIPPNNAQYTEGDEFPSNPKNKEYHRLTYSGLSKDVPARLYRYSSAKQRWIWLETDLRAKYNPTRPTLQEYLTPKQQDTRYPNNYSIDDLDNGDK